VVSISVLKSGNKIVLYFYGKEKFVLPRKAEIGEIDSIDFDKESLVFVEVEEDFDLNEIKRWL